MLNYDAMLDSMSFLGTLNCAETNQLRLNSFPLHEFCRNNKKERIYFLRHTNTFTEKIKQIKLLNFGKRTYYLRRLG